MLDLMASRAVEMHVVMPQIHRIAEDTVVFDRTETAIEEIGETRWTAFTTFEDGMTRRFETIDPDDLHAAINRFEAHLAYGSTSTGFANAASEAALGRAPSAESLAIRNDDLCLIRTFETIELCQM